MFVYSSVTGRRALHTVSEFMHMRMTVLAFAALSFAAPALAQPASSGSGASMAGGQNASLPEGSSQAGTDSAGNRRTCRRIEVDSASRVTQRRVCMTAREWNRYDRESR